MPIKTTAFLLAFMTIFSHDRLTLKQKSPGTCFRDLIDSCMNAETARSIIDQLATSQSVMLATNDIMLYSSLAFAIAAFVIWLGPNTKKR